MKKVFIGIILLLCGLLSFSIFTLPRNNIDSGGRVDMYFKPIDSVWQTIEFKYNSSHVCENEIEIKEYVYGKVYIPQIYIDKEENKSYYIGEIINNGKIDGIEKRGLFRIIKITGEKLLVDDLENTYLKVSFAKGKKISNESDINVVVMKYLEEYDTIVENVELNETDFKYNVTCKLENNDGFFANGMNAYTVLKSKLQVKDGKYVLKNYVFYDEYYDKYFVYKYGYDYDGTNYKPKYQIVYIDVLDSVMDYYSVEGNLNVGNIVIKEQ